MWGAACMWTVAFLLVFCGHQTEAQDNAEGECVCSCIANVIPTDEAEKKEFVEQETETIKKELTVDKKTLSTTTRKKESATDDRPSAKNVGYMGVAMLSMVGVIILLMDATYVIKLYHSIMQKMNGASIVKSG